MDWLASGLPIEGTFASAPCAGDLARRDMPTCAFNERVGVVRSRLPNDWHVCVVLNEQRVVLGLLREQAMRADETVTVEQLMEAGPRTYRPFASPEQLLRYFQKHEERAGVVVTTADGILIGFVLCADAERAQRTSAPATSV